MEPGSGIGSDFVVIRLLEILSRSECGKGFNKHIAHSHLNLSGVPLPRHWCQTFPYMKRSFVRNIILFSYQWFPRSIIIFACVTYVADFSWKYFPSKWHVPLESLVQFK